MLDARRLECQPELIPLAAQPGHNMLAEHPSTAAQCTTQTCSIPTQTAAADSPACSDDKSGCIVVPLQVDNPSLSIAWTPSHNHCTSSCGDQHMAEADGKEGPKHRSHRAAFLFRKQCNQTIKQSHVLASTTRRLRKQHQLATQQQPAECEECDVLFHQRRAPYDQESTLYMLQLAASDAALTKCKQQLELMYEEISTHQQQLAAREEEVSEYQQQLTAKDKDIHNCQQQLIFKDKEVQHYEQQLTAREEEITHLKHQLEVNGQHTNLLRCALEEQEEQCASLQSDCQTMSNKIDALKSELDNVQFELEAARNKGRELLTFQGLTTSQANIQTLKVAMKDLATTLHEFASLACKHAEPRVPTIIDLKAVNAHPSKPAQLCLSGMMHAVLRALDAHVFKEFRCSQIGFCCLDSSMDDTEATLLQLRLESKYAHHWLKLLCTPEEQLSTAVTGTIRQYTAHFINRLHTSASIIDWKHGCDKDVLPPVAEKLVTAALRVQVIASAMHSQLIRVVVPGWLQDASMGTAGINTGAVAPSAWSQWPGVVPIRSCSHFMQAGVGLPAAVELLKPHKVDAAAVFCQEPAVVQLAERVTDLPEFGGQHTAGQGSGPCKVLVKARMTVARV